MSEPSIHEKNRPIENQEEWIKKKSIGLFNRLLAPTHDFLDGLSTRDIDILIVEGACQKLVMLYKRGIDE